jgi:hypothetical protein
MRPPAPLNGQAVTISDDDILVALAERHGIDVTDQVVIALLNEVGETVVYIGPKLTSWPGGRWEYRDRRHTVALSCPEHADVRGWTDDDGIHIAEFGAPEFLNGAPFGVKVEGQDGFAYPSTMESLRVVD